jgi:type II secretory pathway pseudopilin PulG
LLVAITIFGLVTTSLVQVFSRYRERQVLQADIAQVVSMLQSARAETLHSRDRTTYGVQIFATSSVLFHGDTYAGDTFERQYFFSPQVEATTTISGGSVVFERLTGKTTNIGTIELFGKRSTTTKKVITITGTGLISIE